MSFIIRSSDGSTISSKVKLEEAKTIALNRSMVMGDTTTVSMWACTNPRIEAWGTREGDGDDPNFGRQCSICGAPVRAGGRYSHKHQLVVISWTERYRDGWVLRGTV